MSLPSPEEFAAAYKSIKNNVRRTTWHFTDEDDQRDLIVLQAYLPHRIDFGLSPRCEPRTNTDANDWCFENLGDIAIHYERWRTTRVVDGKPLLSFDYSYLPAGRWLLVRRTYLFRDPNDATWFKLVWW